MKQEHAPHWERRNTVCDQGKRLALLSRAQVYGELEATAKGRGQGARGTQSCVDRRRRRVDVDTNMVECELAQKRCLTI